MQERRTYPRLQVEIGLRYQVLSSARLVEEIQSLSGEKGKFGRNLDRFSDIQESLNINHPLLTEALRLIDARFRVIEDRLFTPTDYPLCAVNLSTGGIAFHAAETITGDQYLLIEMRFPGDSTPIRTVAKMVEHREGDNNTLETVAEFVAISAQDRERLTHYTASEPASRQTIARDITRDIMIKRK